MHALPHPPAISDKLGEGTQDPGALKRHCPEEEERRLSRAPSGFRPQPGLNVLPLTHVVAHEGDANGPGVPDGPRVIALELPASALIHEPIFSNQETRVFGGKEGVIA